MPSWSESCLVGVVASLTGLAVLAVDAFDAKRAVATTGIVDVALASIVGARESCATVLAINTLRLVCLVSGHFVLASGSVPAVLADVFVSALILILFAGDELGAALVARIHIVLALAIFALAHTIGHYLIEYLLVYKALVCKLVYSHVHTI